MWENNAKTTILARSPVNIVPRNLAIPILYLDWILPRPPLYVVDHLFRVFSSHGYKDLSKYGIISPHPTKGLATNLVLKHDVAIIDIGCVELIRKNQVNVINKEIKNFTKNTVVFVDGKEEDFDVIIFATGYNKNGSAEKILPPEILKKVVNSYGVIDSGKESPQKGLYFVGYNDFAGRFREISLESLNIAKHLATALS